MSYKPRIKKCGALWLVDQHLGEHKPLPIGEARLRRLAFRWCSKKNVEWVNRIIPLSPRAVCQ